MSSKRQLDDCHYNQSGEVKNMLLIMRERHLEEFSSDNENAEPIPLLTHADVLSHLVVPRSDDARSHVTWPVDRDNVISRWTIFSSISSVAAAVVARGTPSLCIYQRYRRRRRFNVSLLSSQNTMSVEGRRQSCRVFAGRIIRL